MATENAKIVANQIINQSTWSDTESLLTYYLLIAPVFMAIIALITLFQKRTNRTQHFFKLINTTLLAFYFVFLQMLLNRFFEKKDLILKLESSSEDLTKNVTNISDKAIQFITTHFNNFNIDLTLNIFIVLTAIIFLIRTINFFFPPIIINKPKKR